jgi:hypothetical protein
VAVGLPAFASRVSLAIEDHARQARRPWIHADAAHAEAVLFADESELVACLLRDLLRGVVGERWWWRSVLGGLGAEEFLRRRILTKGESLVPAVALLAGAGLAVAWASRLGQVAAREAFDAVARAHALSAADGPFEPAAQRGGAVADLEDREIEDEADAERQAASAALGRLLAIVPEVVGLPPRSEARRLVALALAVAREPSFARGPEFRVAMKALERDAEVPPSWAPKPAAVLPAAARPRRVGGARADHGIDRSFPRALDVAERSPLSRRKADVPDEAAAASVPEPVRATARDPPRAVGVGSGRAASAPIPSDENGVVGERADVLAEEPWAMPRSEVETGEQVGVGLPAREPTGFGGVFYLLNAALALELYADFTEPRTRGIELLPWDWLALVGRAWFGAEFVGDGVWDVLAGLAGRRREDEPGRDFKAPEEWTVGDGWLAPWGESECLRVRRTRHRIFTLHPAGFVFRDVPRDARRDTPARRARARWLRRLLQYLEARLAMALGRTGSADVAVFVCRHEAEIVVTPTRVDVHLALAGLPLEIRVAGLDRDPGWIPAAGRSVYFHYS